MTELTTTQRQLRLWAKFQLAERQADDEGIVDKAEIVAFIKERLGPIEREDRLAILEWFIRRHIVTGSRAAKSTGSDLSASLDFFAPDEEAT